MKKFLVAFIVSIIGAAVFFGMTKPDDLPVALLMVPVLFVFASVSTGSVLLMHVLRLAKSDPKRRRVIAVMCGVVASFLLVLQSTGGIVVGDVVLMIFILGLTYIYITKF